MFALINANPDALVPVNVVILLVWSTVGVGMIHTVWTKLKVDAEKTNKPDQTANGTDKPEVHTNGSHEPTEMT